VYNPKDKSPLNSKNKVLHRLNKLKQLQKDCKDNTNTASQTSVPKTQHVTEMLIMMQDDFVKQKYFKFKKTEEQSRGMNFLDRMSKDTKHRAVYSEIVNGKRNIDNIVESEENLLNSVP